MSLALSACGGGGGGARGTSSASSGTQVNPTQPSSPSADLPPPDVQLTGTGANIAHAAGYTGQGVYIGIVDSGVNGFHPALTGHFISQVSYDDGGQGDLLDGRMDHGTAVAEIAAGQPVGSFPGGVAPGASIVSALVSDGKDLDNLAGHPVTATTAAPMAAANAMFFQENARIVNNSVSDVYWSASNTALTQAFADAYKYVGDTAHGEYGTLYVFAAGNGGKANPSDLASLPLRVTQGIEPGWVTVVALQSRNLGTIATYSNQCGAAKSFCIAAPGETMPFSPAATTAQPAYRISVGTAYAAAEVSGAAAVLSREFPHLPMHAIRDLMLGTADDLGAPGTDAIYGNGRLNLGRAILGPGRLDWGRFWANIGTANVTFSNDISGIGDLYVTGGGKLTLTGHNTQQGTFVAGDSTVEAMTDLPYDVTVSTAGSRVIAHADVGVGAARAGQPTVTSVTGTLQFTAHPSTVHGLLNISAGGHLAVVLGAPVTVDQSATVAGADLRILGAVDGYTRTSHQTILKASSVSGQFATTTLASGVFLSSQVKYSPGEVWMDTTSLSISAVANSSAVMSSSAAATSSAARLDSALRNVTASLNANAAGSSLPDSTLIAAGQIQQAHDDTAARASLESLSGQLYAAGTAVTLAGIDAGNDALMQHLDAMGKGGAWMQSLDSQGGMSRSGYGNVGFNIGGNMVGNDIRLGANGFAGLAVAQMRSNGQLSGNFDRQRNRSTEGSLYVGTQGANWYSVGRVAFGSYRGDTQRLLRFGDMGGAFTGGDYSGRYNVAYGEMGYRSHLGAFDFTPYADVQYASIHRDGFAELGGDGFGLAADGHTTSRWQAGLGLRAGSTWLTSYGKFRMDMKLGWQNAFATKGEVFSARYTGLSQWAPVDGIGLSRQAATLGLNAGMDIGARTQLTFGVDQRFASRDHSRSATASVKVAW
ncbi:S8 family serine peptidase [Luteibacter aegosomaticola]|uniref:autotransporter serine protease n=1 Tax=Luteibacter aegosomaticola TaxID=2911538 RepID=UPI001FF838C6|nr:autotransporter serine protease [Luteibacter aegosomaticola]UPG88851.1 S8 family serine peptidase [Luteibacter aegosomaticola]